MESQLQTMPGWIVSIGGLTAFIVASYFTVTWHLLVVTEAVISIIVFFVGICFLREGYRNIEMEDSEEEIDKTEAIRMLEVEEVRSSTPFYYELEPVIQRRELPPIPRDIGRTYDPGIVDKV